MSIKKFSRTKVEIDDKADRFVSNERFTGVAVRYNEEENRFDVEIPKARVRSDEGPDKIAVGEKTAMYFSRRKTGGYGFVMSVNVPLFKAMGEKGLVEEFRQCVREFLGKIG